MEVVEGVSGGREGEVTSGRRQMWSRIMNAMLCISNTAAHTAGFLSVVLFLRYQMWDS